MSDYLHGVEIQEGDQNVILAAGDTAVMALVGTAPQGAVGEVKLITSAQQAAAEYGKEVAGFTIPSALAAIFGKVSAKVLVINVLAKDKAAALLEPDGKMTRTDDGGLATHIYKETLPEAVDYTIDLVAGLNKLLAVEDTLNMKPNIILVPGYSHLEAVMNKMLAVAQKLEGFAVIDIVAANTQAALEARAGGVFNITNQEGVLCFPQVYRYNENEGTNDLIGLSVYWAICKAIRDGQTGYWVSPSNTELDGIVGLNAEITSSLTDTAADTNLLNGQGIVTVFRKSGMGTRLWGNWTAAFPSKQTTECMIAPRAVRMAIREALVKASITYMDKNATGVMVDNVTGDVNAFMRDLIGQGALADGKCTYNPERNPATQLAQGRMRFSFSVKFNPSLERITFEEEIEY